MNKNDNINFIFRNLDKKITICLLIEKFLDFVYYFALFDSTLFITLPFSIEKEIMVF